MKRPHISAGDGAPDNWDPKQEVPYALEAGKVFGPIFEELKAKLPAGVDCALAISAEPVRSGEQGRVLVFSTDRRKMASLLAQWIVNSDALR